MGSLFAGIGGFDLAASRVWGWDCIRWQVEVDLWCQRVLAKHWPDVRQYGDIRELTGDELEPVDLVCGGFPCQPWSLAGEQRGADDPRHLWPQMFRLVSVLQPTWVVGENVPGLIGMGLDAVAADLEAAGYEVWTLGIPALAVGAPHLRERLWILAYSGRPERPRRNEAARRRKAGTDAGDALGREPAPCGAALADAEEQPQRTGLRPSGARGLRRGRSGDGGSTGPVPDAQRYRLEGSLDSLAGQGADAGGRRPARAAWWAVEPDVDRVADGVPQRVDRLRGLGNAIVPQVAEVLFHLIAEADEQ